jgi:hypothetical protein
MASNHPDKAFINQIYLLLEDLPLEIEEEVLVLVNLNVDQQNYIKVRSVETKDPLVRKLIKKRLHNKMLALPIKAEGSYLLPIRISL